MKAVYIKEFGNAGQLRIHDVEQPIISRPDQVLIRVRAAGLNRADILQRKGFYPAPAGYPERIPGLEFAGEIVEVGVDVAKFAKGDRVFGITAGGAQAEFLITRCNQIVGIPDGMEYETAAAVPEAYMTAFDAVWSQARLKKDESLLIHAVGSGVGLAALDIAKSFGNSVIGTSRTNDKLERSTALGLGHSINTRDRPDFDKLVMEFTDGRGVDVILDLVGGSYFNANLRSLANTGRLMLVGLVGGRTSEFDMAIALQKRLTIIGTVLRSRSEREKGEVTENFRSVLLDRFDKNQLTPQLDRAFGYQEVGKAHEYIESNKNFGKVIIKF